MADEPVRRADVATEPGGNGPETGGEARRRFLAQLSVAGGAISAAAVGIPIVRAAATPAVPTPPRDEWVKVADDIALIDLDVPVRVTFITNRQDAWIDTRALNSVWLFTTDGERFKAYHAQCTHLGCGYLFEPATQQFFCPCHRGRFDIKSGEVLDGPPPRGLDELPVQIRDSAVYVQYKSFRLGIPERIET